MFFCIASSAGVNGSRSLAAGAASALTAGKIFLVGSASESEATVSALGASGAFTSAGGFSGADVPDEEMGELWPPSEQLPKSAVKLARVT
jgi:hypothetical protein